MKIKKAFFMAAVLIILQLALPVDVWASTYSQLPVWMTESRFRSGTRIPGRPVSCGAMINELRRYGMRYHTSQTMRNAILNGVAADSIFNHFIPNENFMRAVLNTVELRLGPGFGRTGYYENEGGSSAIFLATDHFDAVFVHTAPHEIGHAFFGFSDAMSELFTERMQNVGYSLHSPRIQDILNIYRISGLYTHIPIIGGGGIRYYTNFERVLENALDEQDRAYEIWDAAMGVNGLMGMADLWNNEPAVSDIISREDLQMIRGVGRSISDYGYTFAQQMGFDWDVFFYHFTQDWRILTAHLHPEFEIHGRQVATEQERAETLRRFRSWTQAVAAFGRQHGISPEIDVLQYFIESHRYRNQNGLFSYP